MQYVHNEDGAGTFTACHGKRTEAQRAALQCEAAVCRGLLNSDDEKESENSTPESVENSGDGGIIEANKGETAGNDVFVIGKIDRNIYKCVTNDIQTDEVIITERQIGHIKERHPNDYERFGKYFQSIVEAPDYIIEANKPNSALVLKEITDYDEKCKIVLRLITSSDDPSYKNSIITFMKIDDKEWNRLLRNKKILYKSE